MPTFLKYFYLVLLILVTLFVTYTMIAILLIHRELEDRLYLCNTATYTAVDFTVIKDQDQITFTDPTKANTFFKKTIQNTFSLDVNLAPTANSSAALAGPIQVVQLTLKNENTPMTLGGVSLNKNPAVYSVVDIPLKLPYVPGTYTSRVQTLTILPTSY